MYFNIRTERGKKVLKKLKVVYISKGLTLGYIAHTLNFFNLHFFSDVGLTYCFLFCEYKYFNIHIRRDTHTGGGE